MIRYRLQCQTGHEFEAWFRSSSAYDRQAKRGDVSCPECGETNVSKTIMAPGVATRSEAPVQSAPSPETITAAKHDKMQGEFMALMRRMRAEVEKTAEYVGPRFAEEARKIHYEEVKARGIYGEATRDEANSLSEEGIEFLPLPRLPKDKN